MADGAVGFPLLQEIRELSARRKYHELELLLTGLPEHDLVAEPEIGFHLAVAWLYTRQSPQGLALTEKLVCTARTRGNLQLLRRIDLLRSAFLSREGRLDEAQIAVQAAMAYDSWDDPSPFVAEAHNSLGVILSMRGDWGNAVPQLHRALTLFQQLGHRRGVGFVNHNLGLANRYWGRYADAERFFTRAQTYYEVEGTAEERVFTDAERSLAILGLGDVELAEVMARRAVASCEALENEVLLGESLRALGTVLRETRRSADARAVFARSFSYARLTRNPQLEAELHEELALAARSQGFLEKASRHAERASKHYRRIGAWGFERRLSARMAMEVPTGERRADG